MNSARKVFGSSKGEETRLENVCETQRRGLRRHAICNEAAFNATKMKLLSQVEREHIEDLLEDPRVHETVEEALCLVES